MEDPGLDLKIARLEEEIDGYVAKFNDPEYKEIPKADLSRLITTSREILKILMLQQQSSE